MVPLGNVHRKKRLGASKNVKMDALTVMEQTVKFYPKNMHQFFPICHDFFCFIAFFSKSQKTVKV